MWAAQFVSNIGSWMQTVGAQWLMLSLTDSAAYVALVQTASGLPVVLHALLAGAIGDLVDRRALLLVTQSAMLLPHHEITLMCDDLSATRSELSAKGAEFKGEVEDQGFGLVATMLVPGAGEMMLYQPKHPIAYQHLNGRLGVTLPVGHAAHTGPYSALPSTLPRAPSTGLGSPEATTRHRVPCSNRAASLCWSDLREEVAMPSIYQLVGEISALVEASTSS